MNNNIGIRASAQKAEAFFVWFLQKVRNRLQASF
jgi:hypothetical protein